MVKINNKASPLEQASCLIIAVLVMILIGVFGQSIKLTCRRDAEGGPVNCVRQTRTLWVIPLGSKEISQVKAARLSQGIDSEYCSPCFRVELITPWGDISLTSAYTSGSSEKEGVVNKINGFVSDTQAGTLVVTEPGVLSMENIVYSAVWVFIILIWTAIKKAFRRGRPA